MGQNKLRGDKDIVQESIFDQQISPTAGIQPGKIAFLFDTARTKWVANVGAGGDGSFFRPFNTVQGAIDALDPQSIGEWSTIIVMGGTYAENIAFAEKSFLTMFGMGNVRLGTGVGEAVTVSGDSYGSLVLSRLDLLGRIDIDRLNAGGNGPVILDDVQSTIGTTVNGNVEVMCLKGSVNDLQLNDTCQAEFLGTQIQSIAAEAGVSLLMGGCPTPADRTFMDNVLTANVTLEQSSLLTGYDDSSTGLSATNVQRAIEQLHALVLTVAGSWGDPVQDIPALKAVTAVQRDDKQCRLIEDQGFIYRFDAASTSVPDDNLIIKPDDITLPDPGRWLKISAATTFIQLSDTPAAYTGQGGNVVVVNMTEDGLEFGGAPTTSHPGLDDLNWAAAGHTIDADVAMGGWNLLNAGYVGAGTSLPTARYTAVVPTYANGIDMMRGWAANAATFQWWMDSRGRLNLNPKFDWAGNSTEWAFGVNQYTTTEGNRHETYVHGTRDGLGRFGFITLQHPDNLNTGGYGTYISWYGGPAAYLFTGSTTATAVRIVGGACGVEITPRNSTNAPCARFWTTGEAEGYLLEMSTTANHRLGGIRVDTTTSSTDLHHAFLKMTTNTRNASIFDITHTNANLYNQVDPTKANLIKYSFGWAPTADNLTWESYVMRVTLGATLGGHTGCVYNAGLIHATIGLSAAPAFDITLDNSDADFIKVNRITATGGNWLNFLHGGNARAVLSTAGTLTLFDTVSGLPNFQWDNTTKLLTLAGGISIPEDELFIFQGPAPDSFQGTVSLEGALTASVAWTIPLIAGSFMVVINDSGSYISQQPFVVQVPDNPYTMMFSGDFGGTPGGGVLVGSIAHDKTFAFLGATESLGNKQTMLLMNVEPSTMTAVGGGRTSTMRLGGAGSGGDYVTSITTNPAAAADADLVFPAEGGVLARREEVSYLLSSTGSIDAKVAADTTLFTVPSGKTAVITSAIVYVTAGDTITVEPTLGIGRNANADDIYAAVQVTGLVPPGRAWRFQTEGLFQLAASLEDIKLGIDTGATATTMTIMVDLFGYLK